jgi:pyruvate/2-oxoglutarate dehydrogenase complex dihydrolipoamide dehydrogenase (E3) component
LECEGRAYRHAAQFGTIISGPVMTDMARVRQRKRDMVEGEIALHLHLYQTTGGELIMGTGRFVAPKTLEVRLNDGGRHVLAGDQVFLDIGTHAAVPSVPGLEAARPLTHIEALELDYLPSHLVVLGGGYVGLELAQAYRRFGSRVTIIESGPQLMTREDPDIADEMQRILGDEGIQILVAAETLNVNGRSGEEVSLTVRTPSGEQKIDGSDILAAAGRVPNTAGIGLDQAGVELDSRGYIRVNERLETRAPNVWAIGECAGSPQFTARSFPTCRPSQHNSDIHGRKPILLFDLTASMKETGMITAFDTRNGGPSLSSTSARMGSAGEINGRHWLGDRPIRDGLCKTRKDRWNC